LTLQDAFAGDWDIGDKNGPLTPDRACTPEYCKDLSDKTSHWSALLDTRVLHSATALPFKHVDIDHPCGRLVCRKDERYSAASALLHKFCLIWCGSASVIDVWKIYVDAAEGATGSRDDRFRSGEPIP
jgi:hypothetical protein